MVGYEAVAELANDTAAVIQDVVGNITNPVLLQPIYNITWWRGVLVHRNVTVNEALAALGTTVENVNETLNGGMTKEDHEYMLRRCVELIVCALESRDHTHIRLHSILPVIGCAFER